jgi:hypothetical protein
MNSSFMDDSMELIARGLVPTLGESFDLPGPGPVGNFDSGVEAPRPWHMVLNYVFNEGTETMDAEANFTYCNLMMGPVFKTYATGITGLDFSNGTTGQHVVFARLDEDRALDGIEMVIATTATGDDRWLDGVPPDDGTTRIPLYLVTRTSAEDSWSVVVDYRDITLSQYI